VPKDAAAALLSDKEMEQLSSFVHPNIIKLYGEGIHDGKKCLVLEYAANGTLEDLLYRKRKFYFSERRLCLEQIC
jgi:serine/threonine protein kinase